MRLSTEIDHQSVPALKAEKIQFPTMGKRVLVFQCQTAPRRVQWALPLFWHCWIVRQSAFFAAGVLIFELTSSTEMTKSACSGGFTAVGRVSNKIIRSRSHLGNCTGSGCAEFKYNEPTRYQCIRSSLGTRADCGFSVQRGIPFYRALETVVWYSSCFIPHNLLRSLKQSA